MLVTTLLALAGFGISADQVEDMVTRASRLQVEGRYDEAKTVLASALEQSTEVALQATILNNQASVEQDLGNANRAESNYRRAIAMLEKEYGPDSVQLARPLNNLGTLYFEAGKYTKSEQLRRRSLEIRKRVYGPNHPDVGLVLHNLGTVYLYERRYSEAEEMYRQALPMFGNNAGVVWNDLGVLAWMTGDRTSALANLERASASLEAPRERIKVMTNLATAYFDIGRRTDAENCWRSAIASAEKTLGPDSERLMPILQDYARALRTMGRKTEAKALELRIKGHHMRRDTVDLSELLAGRGNRR